MEPKEFIRPQFTTAEVLKLVGVENHTMRRWLNLGYLSPLSMENPGRGRQRLYSLSDIIKIATIHLLSGLGFMPSLYSGLLAKNVESLALLKLIADYAESEGLEIENQWTPEELAEYQELAGRSDALSDEVKALLPDLADLQPWTAKDRYLLIFENSEGDIESKVSPLPTLDRGAWLTVDVHGILNEAMDKINKIKGKK